MFDVKSTMLEIISRSPTENKLTKSHLNNLANWLMQLVNSFSHVVICFEKLCFVGEYKFKQNLKLPITTNY